MKIFQLKNGQYRQLFRAPTFNWCKAVSQRSANSNPLFKIVFKLLEKHARDLLKPCPWIGDFVVRNFSFDRNVISLFPVATYRFIFIASNDEDSEIVRFSLIFIRDEL